MTHSNILPLDIPLHRLLKRQEAAALLSEFEALLPGADLTLVGADGHLFVGTGVWAQAELAGLLAQVCDNTMLYTDDSILQPLMVNSQLVGALVARKCQQDSEGEKQALRSLSLSLTLLFARAMERRDLVRETLDRYRELNLLYEIAETLSGCLDTEKIPELVLGEAKHIIQAEAGLVLLPSNAVTTEGEVDLEIKAHFGSSDYIEALSPDTCPIVSQVYQGGRPSIIADLQAGSPAFGPIVCAPLKIQDQVLGAILLGRLTGQPEFTAGDEKLLMALAGQAAIAIETARLHREEIKQQRMEEELAIGRQIQLSLLPESYPIAPGWEFAAVYRPARQVGGDLYDFFELSRAPRRLGLVIADVTGKGVPAALFMAFCRTIIRAVSAGGRNSSPATALKEANWSIMRDSQSDHRLFLSAFYAILDTHSGSLTYANAGHNWPLWHQAKTGEIRKLTGKGILLGVLQDIELEERTIEVAPGDLVVFYTDGVTEATDANNDMFDYERLHAVLAANAEASAQRVLQAIVEAVEAFIGETPLSDDFTLFVVKRQ